jgi:hypothetical protein
MNTILVWILVSVGGNNGNQVVYSPNFADLATCEVVRKSAEDSASGYRIRSQCLQVKVVVK